MLLSRVALFCLLSGTLPGRAAPQSSSSATAEAVLLQDTLPGLTSRRASAEARSLAARNWFDGQGTLAGAWPSLEGLPLEDPAVLDGRIDAIEQGMIARAAERVSLPPSDLDPRAQTRWRKALALSLIHI